MASISRDPNGRRRILFVDANGNRKTIRLGKTSQRMAEEIKIKVETLNAAKIGGCSLDRESATWLANLGDDLHAKLAAVGLVPARNRMNLGNFLDAFLAKRDGAKANSLKNFVQAKRRLIEHFGHDASLNDITPSMAEDWIIALSKADYAKATIGRTIKYAKQFFKAAIRDKIIVENPFAEIKAPAQTNESRKFFVTLEIAQQIIDACPDAEWRLIFALSRFGGLRCPSEHLTLTWPDVNWEKNRILIHAPKQEHHDDGGDRWIPIFPELRPYLEECFELAEAGAVHVITRYRDASNANLRTQLMRIIKRAGVKIWPKLFHNLRASRETELAATYPLHTVCEWIGNSARIASAHYLQVTDADFERASKCGAESGALAAQNRAQQPSALSSTKSRNWTEAESDCEDTPEVAITCGTTRNDLVRPEGVELSSRNVGKTHFSRRRAAKSGAVAGTRRIAAKSAGRHLQTHPHQPRRLARRDRGGAWLHRIEGSS
jgi:integrase